MRNFKGTFFVMLFMTSAVGISLAQKLTPKETLKATYSDSGAAVITATCGSFHCFAAPVTIYSYQLTCPVVAGGSCTYDIQIAGQVKTDLNLNGGSGEEGLYQFLVDGKAPNGGGTDASGFYAWQAGGPTFVFGTSYNVHSKVKNTVANQKHTVTVKLSCLEILGDNGGCNAQAGPQTLVVSIWTP